MIAPAHAGHLATLRALIREGASEGSFDRELATDSAETKLFFANLRQALVTGYFVVEDARGVLSRRAVPGYVYWPEDRNDLSQPVGFGDLGYELWLTSVSSEWRRNGHGRAMLKALLATPAGHLAWVVCVQRKSSGGTAMERLLEEHTFARARESETTRWYLRADTPEALRKRVIEAPIVTRSLH
jgi:ribosomal protein S18 acetylase RimI-like enzyme